MKALILAAGRGQRMGHLTEEKPKCLNEVFGRSLLEWQIDAMKSAGVTQIAIVTGYRREQLAHRGLVEFNNPQWETTNMVSSLACASQWLESDEVIVSYSDIFYTADAIKALDSITATLAITYDPNWFDLWSRRFEDPLSDAETFRLKSDSTLAEIGQKPRSVDEVEGQYMGLLKFTPTAWNQVQSIRSTLPPETRDRLQMTKLLQLIIEKGILPIHAVPYHGQWGEVDSESDLAYYSMVAPRL